MIQSSSIPLSALELSAAMREALPYDEKRLDRVLRVDERHGLVEVQAATPWKTIAASLRPGDPHAAAMRTTMPTVGESVSSNTAGPDGRPAISHVESIALVTPGGELRRISRTANRELFALVAGGQGLFGALYSVTLDIGSMTRTVNEVAAAGAPSPAPEASASWPLPLLLPPETLDAFLADARKCCEGWRLPLHRVDVRRTHEDKDSFLRWARREYAAVTLHLSSPPVLGVAVRATQLRRELLDAAIARGGSFPVWCAFDATRAQVEACYPQLRSFLAEKRRVDPAEKLTNAWYRHYRNLFARRDCEVRFAS
jgi:FAD/FMN-containing dehydrogenase